MSNALIYGPSGAGKTVNSTRVKGKNLLICTDNSSVVLGNFERKNLAIINVSTSKEFVEAYRNGYESKKYDNIILDNLSDLFDMWILELDESGQYKDMRQAYQLVYQNLKRLSRESTRCGCNTIFTAWEDQIDIVLPDGNRIPRIQPKLPMKVLDNICGLMNVVGKIATTVKEDGTKIWFYVTEGTQTLVAKDQIGCRKYIEPEHIFREDK